MVATVVATTLLSGATPAQAAGTCYGQNPDNTYASNGQKCSADAISLLARDYTAENNASFRMDLRYSRACNAAWGRLSVYSGSNVGYSHTAWNPGGTSVGTAQGGGGTSWTAMVDGSRDDCTGTQFYVNGAWKRWYYLGCA